jgi:hypothetical protein
MPWVKYFLIEDNWCSGFPDAICGTDNPKKDKEFVDFCEKHLIDYGYKCDKKIPSFINNGISYYCHAKTAKQVEKKFEITEVHNDKDQLKERARQDKDWDKHTKTDEYLIDKLAHDSESLCRSKLKRNKFVNELKDKNKDLPKNKVHKRIMDMFTEEILVIDDDSVVKTGPKFKVGDASIRK